MAVFEYQALNESGRKRKGVLEADNERHARQVLREQGLVLLALKSSKSGAKHYIQVGLSVRTRALVVRQLATLIDAGLPIEEALSGIASQSRKGRVRSMLLAIRASVLEGYSFAQALSAYPKAFPTLFQASVQAGEESGKLATVLLALAEHSEQEQVTQQKLQSALLYPALLTIVAMGIVGFLLGSVMPDIVAVFERQNAQLPPLTQGLLQISEGVSQWGVTGLFAIAGMALVVRLSRKSTSMCLWQDRAFLSVPVFGRWLSTLATTRYIATLSMLVRSGVPLIYAMDISSKVIVNQALKLRFKMAQKQVGEGISLSLALSDIRQMPPMMLQLIHGGERSGELGSMLEKAAHQQTEHSQHRMNSFLTLFEPLMLLLMGGAVMMIVMAILLPIMNMNQLLN